MWLVTYVSIITPMASHVWTTFASQFNFIFSSTGIYTNNKEAISSLDFHFIYYKPFYTSETPLNLFAFKGKLIGLSVLHRRWISFLSYFF